MTIQTLPLLGFSPDSSPDTPGAMLDSDQILPTERGIRSGMYHQDVSSGSLANINGAQNSDMTLAVCTGPSTGPRVIAANRLGTSIYDWIAGTRTDITGAALATSLAPWSITGFGNVALVSNISNNILASTTTGAALATVSGAPKASIIVTVGEPNASFVMAFDYNDGTRYQDGIAWSALGDYSSWTPAIATQAGNIRLTDVSGAFTNAIAYRDGVVAFKAASMHTGTYAGGAGVWAWSTLSRDIGCPWQGAAVVAEDVLYFASNNGLWMFDGSYPRRMPGNLHRWWRSIIASVKNPKMAFLQSEGIVLLSYIDKGDISFPRKFLAFNIRSGLWTRYGILQDASATRVQEITADGLYGLTNNTPTKIVSVVTDPSSAKTDAYYYLNAVGSNYGMVSIRGIRPRFVMGPAPTSAAWTSCTVYRDESLRGAVGGTAAGSSLLAPQGSTDFFYREPGYFDGMESARYLLPKITVPANASGWEVVGHDVDVFPDGQE